MYKSHLILEHTVLALQIETLTVQSGDLHCRPIKLRNTASQVQQLTPSPQHSNGQPLQRDAGLLALVPLQQKPRAAMKHTENRLYRHKK